jgi:hypothetical protein
MAILPSDKTLHFPNQASLLAWLVLVEPVITDRQADTLFPPSLKVVGVGVFQTT